MNKENGREKKEWARTAVRTRGLSQIGTIVAHWKNY